MDREAFERGLRSTMPRYARFWNTQTLRWEPVGFDPQAALELIDELVRQIEAEPRERRESP